MLRPKGLPRFEPMFGVASHVPALCGEADANRPGDVDPRTGRVVPAKATKRRKALAEMHPSCPTCGGAIPPGSVMVCMSRHCVAPDRQRSVSADARPAWAYDRTDERAVAKERKAVESAATAAKTSGLSPVELLGVLQDSRGLPAREIERRILEFASADAA